MTSICSVWVVTLVFMVCACMLLCCIRMHLLKLYLLAFLGDLGSSLGFLLDYLYCGKFCSFTKLRSLAANLKFKFQNRTGALFLDIFHCKKRIQISSDNYPELFVSLTYIDFHNLLLYCYVSGGCLFKGRTYKDGESYLYFRPAGCKTCICKNDLPVCVSRPCPRRHDKYE